MLKMSSKNITPLYNKSLEKIRDTRNMPKLIKATYSKPTANIKQTGGKLPVITLKSGTRQGCPFSP